MDNRETPTIIMEKKRESITATTGKTEKRFTFGGKTKEKVFHWVVPIDFYRSKQPSRT